MPSRSTVLVNSVMDGCYLPDVVPTRLPDALKTSLLLLRFPKHPTGSLVHGFTQFPRTNVIHHLLLAPIEMIQLSLVGNFFDSHYVHSSIMVLKGT